jgi:Protein inscuteable C-terminal
LSANKKNLSSVSDDDVNQRSPSASSRAATPPTVIRRPQKIPIYEEIASVKRLSFSAPSSPALDTSEMLSQLDGINFSSTSPDRSRASCRSCKLKRSRVITKNSRSPRSLNSSESFRNYNNETVYLGRPALADDDVMEEKSLLHDDSIDFPAGTSTPKSKRHTIGLESLSELLPPCTVYSNHLLNGNFASVQSWLDSLKFGASSEIMSTLQSKSIETGCLVLTSALAYKMIKSLQTRVFALQREFEAVESSPSESSMLRQIQGLTTQLIEFVASQEPKQQYYAQCPKHYKKVVENLQTIREMVTDLKRLAGKIDVDDLEEYPIGDDLQLIKRYFLVTVRIMFKLLLSVVADSIEHAANEMVMRSNITHLMSLATNEFSNVEGFASLQDAVISNSIVRVLLLVCLENQNELTRALALRTLSAVCTTDETIQQFEINSGFEILRDTITSGQLGGQETKEAISCLASITGPWSRSAETNFKDLKDYAEDYIEAVTKIVEATESPQTMLICVAVLNNLSRLDALSVYSLISNQSISSISKAYGRQPRGEYTIFLLEQITSLLYNMSLNRKSHYHLTSKAVLSFVLDIFLSSYSKQLDGQAKVKAQRAVMKNVTKIMRQLEATSSNHDVEMVWTKINSKLNPHDVSSTSFNISNNAKNVTKISIYSQETFF